MLRYLETFFRARWWIVIPALVMLCAAPALAIMSTGKKYDAGATIWTEASAYLDIPSSDPTLHYQTPAQNHSSRFNEFINTDTFIREIADSSLLGTGLTPSTQTALVRQIRANLRVYPVGDHSLQVHFSHVNAPFALQVVQRAIDGYTTVVNQSSEMQASQAASFYQNRIKEYETSIIPKGNKAMTDYLQTHSGVLTSTNNGKPIDPEFAVLQQQTELDRAQYERYQQRLDDVLTQSQALSKSQSLAFRIVDKPVITNADTLAVTKRQMLLFAGVGVGLSLGYALLFLGLATEMDQTLRNAADIRHRLGLAALEIIPDYTSKTKLVNSSQRMTWSPKLAQSDRGAS